MPRTTLNGSLNGDSRLSYTGSRLWYALNVLEQMRADRLDCPVLLFVPKRIAYPTEHTTAICSRSEEHTSELQSLMRISYAVFCLKKKNQHEQKITHYA